MFELTVRLIGAGLVTFAAGMLDATVFDFAWKILLFFGVYSLVGYQLELRNMKNAGIAGFIAVADAIIIALLLGSVNRIDDLGFLALAPCAYAAARYGSMPTAMAPLAATGLISSSMVMLGKPPTAILMVQAGAVLLVGLLMNHRRIIVTVNGNEQASIPVFETEKTSEPEDVIELRASYRELREKVRDLETSGRRDRVCCQLYETKMAKDDSYFKRFARKVKDLCKVESVTLYTLSQFADTMVVRSSAGEANANLQDAALPIDTRLSQAQLQDRVQSALTALIGHENKGLIANVLLTLHGRVTGMLVLHDPNPIRLSAGKDVAESMSGFIASMLYDESKRAEQERRLKETELLYEIATICNGADTPNNLAARVVREVETIIDTDHLSIHWLDDGYSIMAAHMGATYQALDAVSFANGPGLDGWLSVGAPELNMIDISKDARCNSEISLKMRIGSLCVVPIQFSDKPFGFVCATTCRTGGLDTPEIETLRVVAAEMGQALARLMSASEPQAGLMTPREFQSRIQEQGEGCIVALETLRKKQLSETFGRPAIEHAQRQLALRIRSKLPTGGCICRRSQGDYAVYLPGCNEPFARSWANEIAALASMIGLRTPDGKSRIPLAVRGKAAKIEKTQQITEEVGS